MLQLNTVIIILNKLHSLLNLGFMPRRCAPILIVDETLWPWCAHTSAATRCWCSRLSRSQFLFVLEITIHIFRCWFWAGGRLIIQMKWQIE